MAEDAEQDGAWIFVSHCHRDLKKVREIRDLLEREGHKPLLFYLKCLEEDDARLPELIKNEIEARTWFVLCDSENARSSRWVREEMRLVQSMEDKSKFHVTIDLAQDIASQRDKLVQLSKRATVYISHSVKDMDITNQIHRELADQDYRVLAPIVSKAEPGFDWQSFLHSALEEAVKRGFVLLLLSDDYLTSKWCQDERATAFAMLKSSPMKDNIVPVVIKDHVWVMHSLPADLVTLQCVDFSTGSLKANIRKLLADLKTRKMV